MAGASPRVGQGRDLGQGHQRPAGAVRAHANRDRVADLAQLLGEDTDPSNGFTLIWDYPDEGILAHLGIQAIGPGGTTEETLYIGKA